MEGAAIVKMRSRESGKPRESKMLKTSQRAFRWKPVTSKS